MTTWSGTTGRTPRLSPSAPLVAGPAADKAPPLLSAFAIAVLVLSTGAFFALSDATADSQSWPVVLALWLAAYAVAAVGLFDGILRERRTVRLPILLIALLGLAVASITWSTTPDVTFRRAVALLGTVLVGLFLAQRLRPVEVLDAVRRAVLLVALASLILHLLGDPRVLDVDHGTLRGVVATKNSLGRLMALGLVSAAAVALLDRSRRVYCLGSALPMIVALALTDSAASLVVVTAGLLSLAGVALWRFDMGKSLFPMSVTLALAGLILLLPVMQPQVAPTVLGRDATLTGRTDIWSESLAAASVRPLLGYGYGGFWSPEGSEGATRIRARLGYAVAHAHNGFLDVTLALGVVGLVVVLLLLVHMLVSGFREVKRGFHAHAVLRLLVVGLALISTAAESGLVQENTLLTLLLVVALVASPPRLTPTAKSRAWLS